MLPWVTEDAARCSRHNSVRIRRSGHNSRMSDVKMSDVKMNGV